MRDIENKQVRGIPSRSAKPLCADSIPTRASNLKTFIISEVRNRHQWAVRFDLVLDFYDYASIRDRARNTWRRSAVRDADPGHRAEVIADVEGNGAADSVASQLL